MFNKKISGIEEPMSENQMSKYTVVYYGDNTRSKLTANSLYDFQEHFEKFALSKPKVFAFCSNLQPLVPAILEAIESIQS